MKRILFLITLVAAATSLSLRASDPGFKTYELTGLLAIRLSNIAGSTRPDPADTEDAIRAEISAAMLGKEPAGQPLPVVLTNPGSHSLFIGGSPEQHARLAEWLKTADHRVQQYFVRIDNDLPVPVSEAGRLAIRQTLQAPYRYSETVFKAVPVDDTKLRLTGSFVVSAKSEIHHPIDVTLEIGKPVTVDDQSGKEHTFLLIR